MKKYFFIFQIFILFNFAKNEKFRFDNYTLFSLNPRTNEQIEVLRNVYRNKDLDFFHDPVKPSHAISVVSSPSYRNVFENLLNEINMEYKITSENIQELINNQKIGTYDSLNRNTATRSMTWDAYYTLDGIYSWLDDLVAQKNDTLSLVNVGKSYENRDIKGVKLSHGLGRKIIFIEGGIHSREWISPATVNYILNELLYSTDPETQALANDFDWYFFPVTNPDGYIWTHEQYRLWRKNRRPVGTEFGIDLNRNWDSNWMLNGSSSDPSTNTYAGTAPFSEPETRVLADFIASIANDIDMYLSFHSSGQILLLPYGNTTEPLDNYYDAIKIGRRAMGSLSVRYGTLYTSGNVAEAIYEATGSSVDWVKEKFRVPLAYCYELRDKGVYGHLLPADQILPNSEEVMDSLQALVREARPLGYLLANSDIKVASSLLIAVVLVVISLFI